MNNYTNIPVYPNRRRTAERFNQMEYWKNSRNTNIICRNDLSDAIQRLHNSNAVPDEYRGHALAMLAKYGPERIMFLLCITVKHHQRNGTERPFTLNVRNWASSSWPMAPLSTAYIISAPAVAVMRFIDACYQVEEEM